MRVQSSLPLASHRVFTSTRFDEIEALYAGSWPIHIEPLHRPRVFQWRAHHATVGDLNVSAHETNGGWRITSENAQQTVLMCVPLAKTAGETSRGKERVALVPGKTGAVVQHGVPGRVEHAPNYRCLHVDVPQHALDRALTLLTGTTTTTPVQFELSWSLVTPASRVLLRLLSCLVEEADDANVPPAALQRYGEALIIQLLHAQPHNHSRLLAAPVASDAPWQIRRVADYLTAHCARALSMSDLTKLTETSARSIQVGFQKHFGCSPMTFLRVRRLERARALLSTQQGASILEIAQACGFHHAGHFGAYYRAHFGETPTETRRRRPRSRS